MIPWEEMNEEQRDPVVEAIRILARRGRAIREGVRETREAPHNAIYEGVTPEERGIAVYAKWRDGQLPFADMTRLEWESWVAECERQSRQTRNLIWNAEHHRYLLKRIDSVWDKFTEDEQQAILDLLKSCEWGDDEVQQVKEIVETAGWFSKLAS